MKAVIVSFTKEGACLGKRVQTILEALSYEVNHREPAGRDESRLSLSDWTEEAFRSAGVLVFIGACGIAVRTVAPFLQDKYTDPPVLVMDDSGKFCIPLVSGHVGGANRLAEWIGSQTGALPVVTTATDLRGCFAADSFAAQRGMYLEPRGLVKEVSASLLRGESVSFQCELGYRGEPPKNLVEEGTGELGIFFTYHRGGQPFSKTLFCIQRVIYLGIGCKKQTPFEKIETMISQLLKEAHIPWEALAGVGSIDLKKQEPGLRAFCAEHDLPFTTYAAKQLQEAAGDFLSSAFVKEITGVDNICERAAVLASGQGRLIWRKTAGEGVTAALALKEEEIDFGKCDTLCDRNRPGRI